ncbi:dihydrodipicolinate synthase family protein [Pseudonocardia sp. CA-107938]|uniref:dihydrodipicolinate synthase family protein n=1 Tax=Pseudonocardia sp. CA-107938 TaxID=3240021 RepID=UPI003D8B6C17
MSRAEVLAALPTFFDVRGELDRPTTAAHLDWLATRVDGVFVAGTTGEFPALDRPERVALAELALAAFGADRVVVHVGAASTREAVALTRDVVAAGVRRVAALTPYYLPADADAVARHFAAIVAAAGNAATYGYLFTERSGVDVTPAEFGGIAAATGLAGVKLSGSANDQLDAYLDALPAGARLWSGADTTLGAVVRRGGAGIVSGLSAAFPEVFAALADAVATGDAAAERAAQQRADAVLAATRGSVEGIKHALTLLGFGTGALRMPAPALPDPDAIARLVPAPVA